MSEQVLITDFVDNLFVLWEEILGIPAKETGPAWVLDRNAGWAQTLVTVSEAAASRTPRTARDVG